MIGALAYWAIKEDEEWQKRRLQALAWIATLPCKERRRLRRLVRRRELAARKHRRQYKDTHERWLREGRQRVRAAEALARLTPWQLACLPYVL